MVEVIPAILVKRREDLLERIKRVHGLVSSVHIDVMDKEFVPNWTVGPDDFADLPAGMDYEFHWMVMRPENWIAKVPGNHLHMVHIEAVADWDAVKGACRKAGGRLGIAMSPETPVSKIEPVLKDVTRVIVMAVIPGYDGQKYLPEIEPKIRELRGMFPKLEIEVDGGITPFTARRAAEAGADKLAAASAIYSAPDTKLAIENIRNAAERK